MQYVGNGQLLDELMADDIAEMLDVRGVFDKGYYINPDTGKLERMAAISHDPPWIYTNPDPERYCMTYMMMFNSLKIIPKRCLDCWKVVVAPRSFHELMQLYELEVELSAEEPDAYCKCGIEIRDYVPRHYGGYFYTNSQEAGMARYHQVRGLVDEKISKETSVILKRFCTEFELKFGRSDRVVRPAEADRLETTFWQNVTRSKEAALQPDWVKQHVMAKWMKFAWGRGDKTVTLYNGGVPLYTPSYTYHDKEKTNG